MLGTVEPVRMVRRILIVTSGLRIGGAEVFLSELVPQLVKGGASVIVASLDGPGPLADSIQQHKVHVCFLRDHNKLTVLSWPFKLRKLIRQFSPDLVQGWMYHGNVASSLACAGLKIPVVWSVHHSLADVGAESARLRMLLWLSRSISHWPAAIQYCATSSAAQHESFGFGNKLSVVIPNGVDCDRFNPANRQELLRGGEEFGLPHADRLIIHIGRYHPMKDHMCFLEAASLAVRRYPALGFLMVGAGVTEENAELVRRRDELGLALAVKFLGVRRDVDSLFGKVDLLSTSSAWGEAFPISVCEAMASGIPCVVTDVGDCAELVGDTGLVVPPRTPSALADAWVRLLEESQQAMARRRANARQRIVDHSDIRQIGPRFLELYETVIKKTRSALDE